MEYKVVPFTATLNQPNETPNTVASQLENLITRLNNQGWEYVRLESVATYIQPQSGGFGLAAKPGYMASYQMAVFSKS